MEEKQDMTPYINTQLLLDRIDGRTVSTVKLGEAHAKVHGAAYETVIFTNSRTSFIESGPFYYQTEEEARAGHERCKNWEEMQMMYLLGAHY